MTEDDTYLRLKRRPLLDVFNEFKSGRAGSGAHAVYLLMTRNHWTLMDYYDIYYDQVLSGKVDMKKEDWIIGHHNNAIGELKQIYGDDFEL